MFVAGVERVGFPVRRRCGLASEAGRSAWRRPGQRAEAQRLQAGQVDCPVTPGRIRPDQVRLHLSVQGQGLVSPRRLGLAAVQAAGLCQPDQR